MENFDIRHIIRYIRENSGVDALAEIPDDDIEVILDLIMDYYDRNGFLDMDSDDDSEADAMLVAEYVNEVISKDIPDYPLIPYMKEIVRAEMSYENLLLQ